MTTKVSVYKCPDGTDFPVEWDDPNDEKFGWFWDQMHCPLPLTPLSHQLWQDVVTGFVRAFDVTGNPGTLAWTSANGYAFNRMALFDDDPAVRTAVRERDMARREERLLDLWRTDYQPEVQALTLAIRTLAASLDRMDAGEALDQLHAARRRHGELHMLAIGLTGASADRFIGMCRSEFGPEGEQIAMDLMGGFYNKSLESAQLLWELAQTAKQSKVVETLVREEQPRTVLAEIESVEGGPAFRRRLNEYLEVYGHRNESFSELSFPTWREEPRFPLMMIRRYIDTPEDSNPRAMLRRVEVKREQRLASVLPRLAGDAEQAGRFKRAMGLAQQRTVLIEDHNFYIDQQGPAASREVCMAIGSRLALSGAIDKPEDTFYLEEQEVRAAMAGGTARYQAIVAERRAERERWMRVLPPASIGSAPVFLPPALQQFFGPVANEPMEAGAFKGVAGSAGVIRGTARVILGLDDIDRLAPGEILVTYATAPPWTPAFAIAGGIVTDVGGTLSHCAVVAREYGIPAVVGTRIATATIQDGQLITVDGSNGIVRLEE